MLQHSTDELNNLETEKRTNRTPIPIDEYFGEMELTDEQKHDREGLTLLLIPVFEYIFEVASTLGEDVGLAYLYSLATRRINDAIRDFNKSFAQTDYVKDTTITLAQNLVNATLDHKGDKYYTSHERAVFAAENEANRLCNDFDYENARDGGYTHKTWIAMNDSHTRATHAEISGVTIPIDELFEVGGSQMRFPMDEQYGASAEEIVGCRCSVVYINS